MKGKNLEQGVSASRVAYLDLLRVIAVACMMMLHICASQLEKIEVNSFDWQVLNVYDSLARFCVPIFVMISGVFFLNPKREYTIGKILKNNVWRIVTAYLFWAVCYAAVVSLEECRAFNGEFFKMFVEQTITGRYHLWFLNMIVGIYLVVPFLRKIAADRKLLEYFIILSFVFCFVGNLVRLIPMAGEWFGTALDKVDISMVLGFVGYFMAGYYFYTYELEKKKRTRIYIMGILSLLITMLATGIMSVHAGRMNVVLYNYLLPNICFSAWSVFLLFRYGVSKHSFSEKARKAIGKLAELSFGMYLVHDFVNMALKVVKVSATSFNPVLAVPVLTCVVFAVSFVVIWVLSKIPAAKKYLM